MALEPEAAASAVGGALPASQQAPVPILPPVGAQRLPPDGGRLLGSPHSLGLCLRTAGERRQSPRLGFRVQGQG